MNIAYNGCYVDSIALIYSIKVPFDVVYINDLHVLRTYGTIEARLKARMLTSHGQTNRDGTEGQDQLG